MMGVGDSVVGLRVAVPTENGCIDLRWVSVGVE